MEIYIYVEGDPTLLKKDFDNFALKLSNIGVKRVSGNLVGDDTWFDAIRLSPGIEKNDESYYYAAQISALTVSPNTDYDAGTVIVDARPTAHGKAAKVTLTPKTNVVRVVNKSKTVPKGTKNTLRIVRQYGKNNIVITGNAPLGSTGKKGMDNCVQPDCLCTCILKQSLISKGIKFAPSSKVVRGKTAAESKVLCLRVQCP